MPHGGYHGVVQTSGGTIIQQGSSTNDKGEQVGGGVYNPGGYANEFDTGKSGDASDILSKGLSPTDPKDAEIINALNNVSTSASGDSTVTDKDTKSVGILQPLFGGSTGSIEGYDPSNLKYNLAGQHPLSQQFVRLADKYYKGDQAAFAQTSQGQTLLNYLKDVPYTKGGLLGAPTKELEEKLAGLNLDIFDEDILMGEDYEPFKTINIPVSQIRNQPNLDRLGPLTSEDYRKFNQFLFATRPDLFGKARPFSSGQALPNILSAFLNPRGIIQTGVANQVLQALGKDPLKAKEPFKGIAEENKFIEELLKGSKGLFGDNVFALNPNLSSLIQPLDTDQGGMNDVAQAIINQNVVPPNKLESAEGDLIALLANAPDGGITTAFDPDSFLAGFGMA
jgi:hypothetical protein